MKGSRLTIAMLSLSLLAGCGADSEPFAAAKKRDDTLSNPDTIRAWVNTASAFALYANAYEPIAVADGAKSYDDPRCPLTTDDGTTLDIAGGCTDATGATWVGRASVKRHADGARDLTLEDFGFEKGGASDTRNGEASVRRIDDGSEDFSLNLSHENGTRVTIDYEGHVDGAYGARTVWSGAGTVVRELVAPTGSLEVTTSAEVVDNDVCGVPASGNTTLTDDAGNTVVVTYDGAVDCDDAEAAPYTLNGVSKGKITGIACTTRPGRTGSRAEALLVLALSVARLTRWRTRRINSRGGRARVGAARRRRSRVSRGQLK